MGGQHHALAALPLGMTWCPSYRRLDGPQGHSEWMQKILPLLGFNPQTVQPIENFWMMTLICSKTMICGEVVKRVTCGTSLPNNQFPFHWVTECVKLAGNDSAADWTLHVRDKNVHPVRFVTI